MPVLDRSPAALIAYINRHYEIFGFRPDQIKLTPEEFKELCDSIELRFPRAFDGCSLNKFMGVDIVETEQVQDGTKHDVFAAYRISGELITLQRYKPWDCQE